MALQLDPDIGWAVPNTETPDVEVDVDVSDDTNEYDIVATQQEVDPGDTFPYSEVQEGLDASEVWSFNPRSNQIRCACQYETFTYLGYDDGVVIRVDTRDGSQTLQKSVHANQVAAIDANENGGIATASFDGTVKFFDANLNEQWSHSFHDQPDTGEKENVNAVSAANGHVYSGGILNNEVIAVDDSDGTELWRHQLHQGDITGVHGGTVTSVTLDSAALGDQDEIIRVEEVDLVWSCAKNGFVGAVYARDRTFENFEGTVSKSVNAGEARWSVDTGKTLYSIDLGGTVVVGGENGFVSTFSDWNGTGAFQSQDLSGDVLSVSMYDRDVYAGTENGRVRAIDTGESNTLWEHQFHTGQVYGLANFELANEERYVVSGSADFTAKAVVADTQANGTFTRIGNTESLQVDYTNVGNDQWIYDTGTAGSHDLALRPDEQRVYAATLSGKIFSINTVTGNKDWEHSRHGAGESAYGVNYLEDVSGNNRDLVVSGGTDRAVRVYDAGAQSEVNIHGFHDGSIYSLGVANNQVFSGDSQGTLEAATFSGDPGVFTSDWTHNHHDGPIYEITAHNGVVYSVSSDGTLVAANQGDGSLIYQVENHNGDALRSVDVDDSILITGGFDNRVIAQDPSDGSVIWRHSHHYRNVYGVQIGDDGVIYSGAYDNKVRAAAREDGSLLWTHNIQNNSVRDIEFLSSANSVVSASWDATVASVDDGIFYPFTNIADSGKIRFTDKHVPTDLNQQVTYGVARVDTAENSQIRVSQTLNIPFRLTPEISPALAGPATEYDERVADLLELEFNAIGSNVSRLEELAPARESSVILTRGPAMFVKPFFNFGRLEDELTRPTLAQEVLNREKPRFAAIFDNVALADEVLFGVDDFATADYQNRLIKPPALPGLGDFGSAFYTQNILAKPDNLVYDTNVTASRTGGANQIGGAATPFDPTATLFAPQSRVLGGEVVNPLAEVGQVREFTKALVSPLTPFDSLASAFGDFVLAKPGLIRYSQALSTEEEAQALAGEVVRYSDLASGFEDDLIEIADGVVVPVDEAGIAIEETVSVAGALNLLTSDALVVSPEFARIIAGSIADVTFGGFATDSLDSIAGSVMEFELAEALTAGDLTVRAGPAARLDEFGSAFESFEEIQPILLDFEDTIVQFIGRLVSVAEPEQQLDTTAVAIESPVVTTGEVLFLDDPLAAAFDSMQVLTDDEVVFADDVALVRLVKTLQMAAVIEYDEFARADEFARTLGRPTENLDTSAILKREFGSTTASSVSLFSFDRPARALLETVLADEVVVSPDEVDGKIVSVRDEHIDYIEGDTVPIVVDLPVDISPGDDVVMNIDPLYGDGPSKDPGGKARIVDAEENTVAYFVERGETDESGLYTVSWTVDGNRTVPDGDSLIMRVNSS